MKKLFLLFFLLYHVLFVAAQNVGIGTTTPNVNAALEIKASNKGILMPRTSSAARQAMPGVVKGMMVYDTTYSAFYYNDGNRWRSLGAPNTDSMVKHYLSSPEVTQNMVDFFSNVTTTANSGLLYDNGGPSGNYSNNALDGYGIFSNDSTVGYRLVVEQFNLENLDSLVVVVANDQEHPLHINSTGTYNLPGGYGLVFIFKSNASVNQAGFRIRWSKMIAVKDSTVAVPAFGWYFDPSRLAVRGGMNFNNNWNSDSLGKYSFGFGSNVKAKGSSSFVFGENASATANYSHALGYQSLASGIHATAIGQETKATGTNAFAVGWQAQASGAGGLALGSRSQAAGEFSAAFGEGSYAGDYHSVGLGSYARAEGRGSHAVGLNTLVTGSYSTAVGQGASVTQQYASAFGNIALASGDHATAVGDSSVASGSFSSAIGHKARTTGQRSTAMGSSVTARSYASTALGFNNNPVNSSSVAAWVATDPLLIVGNGVSATATSNALMILKNGNTGIGTNAPATKLHIAAGTDANLTNNSGFMVLGDVSSTNIVFDNNEIFARNNGAVSTLFLQNSGGAFEVGGSAAKPGGGTWSATSDARLKQNVSAYKDGLQQVLKINPVQYHYNNLSGYDTTANHIGVIAQELQPVAPYMVNDFKKDGEEYLKVDNSAMTYMLINAVKEQQQMIHKQQQQIDELKKLLQQKSTSHN
ncbi:MAG: hypothetical protein EOP51_22105 [Sphingobacteriales bacterium]|nr:MAG: hypothetical protein EOP51_22105 [Sphingobacteriales bacterium]